MSMSMVIDRAKQFLTNNDHQGCLHMLDDEKVQEWPLELLEIKAFCLQKTQQYEEALEAWNTLILRNNEEPDYYENRGICKFHLRLKSSMEDMDKAIELDSDNGYRYSCRAYIKDKIGDTEGCIEDYKISLELDPNNEITLNNLGLAEEKLGYTRNARERFKKSDQLLGIDKHMEKFYPEKNSEKPVITKTNKWKEIKKMLSSPGEFKSFMKEAMALFSKK
jgi:tetratricopeptide (TPR) repeat protein